MLTRTEVEAIARMVSSIYYAHEASQRDAGNPVAQERKRSERIEEAVANVVGVQVDKI